MRKLMFSMFLGLGLLGFALPTQAKASWLSQSEIQVNVGPQYAPGYGAPVQAYYPAYGAPAYAAPAYSYYRSPGYAPAFRPAPIYQPRQSFYGPGRFEPSRYEPRRDWHEGRGEREWRR